jgi:hypothetical protein
LVQPRIFSLEEANVLLPHIADFLEQARGLNEASINLRSHLKELVTLWGQQIFEKGNPDYSYYSARIAEREALAKELHAALSKITEMGAIVKDLDEGLVDFYCRHNGQLVFLCWKLGESRIGHWHPISGNYKVRRPVDELRQTTLKDQAALVEKSA